MIVESVIHMDEHVDNRDRQFGSAPSYFPVWVHASGEWMPALFTQAQINEAVLRARKNPEDIPRRKRSWLERLLGL